jgi:hypothetical protein
MPNPSARHPPMRYRPRPHPPRPSRPEGHPPSGADRTGAAPTAGAGHRAGAPRRAVRRAGAPRRAGHGGRADRGTTEPQLRRPRPALPGRCRRPDHHYDPAPRRAVPDRPGPHRPARKRLPCWPETGRPGLRLTVLGPRMPRWPTPGSPETGRPCHRDGAARKTRLTETERPGEPAHPRPSGPAGPGCAEARPAQRRPPGETGPGAIRPARFRTARTACPEAPTAGHRHRDAPTPRTIAPTACLHTWPRPTLATPRTDRPRRHVIHTRPSPPGTTPRTNRPRRHVVDAGAAGRAFRAAGASDRAGRHLVHAGARAGVGRPSGPRRGPTGPEACRRSSRHPGAPGLVGSCRAGPVCIARRPGRCAGRGRHEPD